MSMCTPPGFHATVNPAPVVPAFLATCQMEWAACLTDPLKVSVAGLLLNTEFNGPL